MLPNIFNSNVQMCKYCPTLRLSEHNISNGQSGKHWKSILLLIQLDLFFFLNFLNCRPLNVFSPKNKQLPEIKGFIFNYVLIMYILVLFILAVQLVFDVPCKETLYGAAKPGPSLSVTVSNCSAGSLLHIWENTMSD